MRQTVLTTVPKPVNGDSRPVIRHSCSTCQYWQSDPTPGSCHRHPPTNSHWPLTKAEDWCGDYR